MKRILVLFVAMVCVAGWASEVSAANDTKKGTIAPGDNLDAVKAQLSQKPNWALLADLTTETSAAYIVTIDDVQFAYELMATPISKTIYSIATYYYFTSDDWPLVKNAYEETVGEYCTYYQGLFKKNAYFDEPYSERNKPLEALHKGKARLESVYDSPDIKLTVELKGVRGPDEALVILSTTIGKEEEQLNKKEKHPLKFRKDVYDFGSLLADGSVYKAEFEFENQYGVPVTITGVKCYTGKFTPEYPKEPIPPYGKSSITINWRTNYNWGEKKDGDDFHASATVEYRFGSVESSERLQVRAEHLYFPRTVVYDRPIGDLHFSCHKKGTTGWYYKLCGQRNFEMDFAFANFTKKDVKLKIVFWDGTTKKNSTIVDNSVIKAENEYSFSVPVSSDGKLKTEEGLLKFYVNNKLQATDTVSFILWDEADKATQEAWIKTHPEHQECGRCESESSVGDFFLWDDWW